MFKFYLNMPFTEKVCDSNLVSQQKFINEITLQQTETRYRVICAILTVFNSPRMVA